MFTYSLCWPVSWVQSLFGSFAAGALVSSLCDGSSEQDVVFAVSARLGLKWSNLESRLLYLSHRFVTKDVVLHPSLTTTRA